MENDILNDDHGTKVAIIKKNMEKYSVSVMRDVLQIARSTFYYEYNEQPCEDDLVKAIVAIFNANRKVYGTQKINFKLKEQGCIVSRRRIGSIMRQQGLVLTYTVA